MLTKISHPSMYIFYILSFISMYCLPASAQQCSEEKPKHSTPSLPLKNKMENKTEPHKGFLQLQKQDKTQDTKTQAPIFYLTAHNLKIGEIFKIAHQNAFGRTIIFAQGMYLGNGRMFLTEKSSKKEVVQTYIPTIVGGLAQGEPSSFLLLDEKENTVSSIPYTPHPLEVTASDGAKLSISRLDIINYLCTATNLKPHEQITLISTAGPEKLEATHTINDEGTFSLYLNPEVIGMPTAKCNLTIKRHENSLSLDYTYSNAPIPPSPNDPFIIFTINNPPSKADLKDAEQYLK